MGEKIRKDSKEMETHLQKFSNFEGFCLSNRVPVAKADLQQMQQGKLEQTRIIFYFVLWKVEFRTPNERCNSKSRKIKN